MCVLLMLLDSVEVVVDVTRDCHDPELLADMPPRSHSMPVKCVRSTTIASRCLAAPEVTQPSWAIASQTTKGVIDADTNNSSAVPT